MSFFIRGNQGDNKAGRGARKKPVKGRKGHIRTSAGGPKPKRPRGVANEEISSEEEISSSGEEAEEVEGSLSEEDVETAQEKRLRLAKQYLSQLENEGPEKDDGFETDPIAHRLKQDILEQSGKLHKEIAKNFVQPDPNDTRILRGHQLPVTCVVITQDEKFIFSGSKDCSIIKWSVETGKKLLVIPGGRKGTEKKHIGHTAHVLCLAVSTDSKFLASGDRNKLIQIWNPDTCERLHIFYGHRDAVSGLAFRKGTHQLFSASHDRSVKIWSLDEMAYVETLFGHEDVITGIDSLTRDRAATSGGRDGSVRIWKVVEESQLVFNSHRGSVDCIALINEEHFISGADDNSIALWGVHKKKPLALRNNAHSGLEENTSTSQENWITSVASLQHTDLVASGSKDGCIRMWQCGKAFKSIVPLFSIPVVGFVNGLQFSSSGRHLVAGVGQEHRLGRWWRLKEAKNAIYLFNLKRSAEAGS